MRPAAKKHTEHERVQFWGTTEHDRGALHARHTAKTHTYVFDTSANMDCREYGISTKMLKKRGFIRGRVGHYRKMSISKFVFDRHFDFALKLSTCGYGGFILLSSSTLRVKDNNVVVFINAFLFWGFQS